MKKNVVLLFLFILWLVPLKTHPLRQIIMPNKRSTAIIIREREVQASRYMLVRKLTRGQIAPTEAFEIVNAVEKYCNVSSLTKEDVLAMIWQESRFKKNAIGLVNKRDHGLMQINKTTFNWLLYTKRISNVTWGDMFTIEKNVYVGCTLLKVHEAELIRYGVQDKRLLRNILIESYNKGVGGALFSLKYGFTFDYLEAVEKKLTAMEVLL